LKIKAPVPIKKNESLNKVDFEAGTAILINKPAGITSFDVVYRIRKLIGVKKVGHAGTLDPAATGLLILLTGKGTRTQDQFMGLDKEYQATILMGVETTTWDLDGEITGKQAVPELDKTDVERIFSDQFTGEFEQVPPAYSALKVNGIPGYKLARRGRMVNLAPRRVTVQRIEIMDWSWPEFTVKVHCSSGFYVRSLAHDIGAVVGCGGVLKQLVRTRIGPYQLTDAFELDEFERITGEVRRDRGLR
jgi:tRNA pseudouridine55 synthase